jgi:hypothetical protein
MDTTVNPDNVDIAETVLEARKEYLANAKETGSDTSEADAQVKEIEAAIANANNGFSTDVSGTAKDKTLSEHGTP